MLHGRGCELDFQRVVRRAAIGPPPKCRPRSRITMSLPKDWHRPRWWVPLSAYDLVSLESEEEQSAARRHVYRQLSLDWRFWITVALLMGLVMPATIWGSFRLMAWIPRFGLLVGAILGGLVGGGVVLVVLRAFRRRSQTILRAYLVRQGKPVCMACGYFLRGITEERCPECGAPCRPSRSGP